MTRSVEPWGDPDDDLWAYEQPIPEQRSIEVEMTEPAVIGTLYDPTGEVLVTVYDRTVIPFGFRSSKEQ